MPTPKVVATLPFSAAVARSDRPSQRTPLRYDASGPATLSFADADASRRAAEIVGDAHRELLEEATELAHRLGCDVRRRALGGAGGGCRWVHGRLRVVLDVEATPRRRLAVLASALRGAPRLARSPMSAELADYLTPCRAA